ncbi:MAG: hypothetical protein KME08_02615 [Aphanothece sp. CMT-3BRIN-NPC111]|jgi:hypothetical protein|nr:hypothetical protein [Aphanothece sp. CMT-3BRIN-NPC111]
MVLFVNFVLIPQKLRALWQTILLLAKLGAKICGFVELAIANDYTFAIKVARVVAF